MSEFETSKRFEENRKKVFAAQLKDLMEKWKETTGKKLTQAKLAEHVHVDSKTVSRWLSGETYPLNDENAMRILCDFFKVPHDYFGKSAALGLSLTEKSIHDRLDNGCHKLAERIGLSSSFVEFIKGNPDAADKIISLSQYSEILQSDSPDVPELPDKVFQFVSSVTGVKIYPSEAVLRMLRVIQRDVEEYTGFLLDKYAKEFAAADDPGFYFRKEAEGCASLSADEYSIVSASRLCSPARRKKWMEKAMVEFAHGTHERRKAEGNLKHGTASSGSEERKG